MEITEDYIALVTRAHAYATERQDVLRREFRLAEWPRWDWDQETRQLVFSDGGVPKVIAEIQFTGTTSTETGTWLWAWDNPSMDPATWQAILEVRRAGESLGIAQLTTPKWTGDANDGWEMTSISAFVLQAKGVYRTPRDEGGFTYMVITAIDWAPVSP